MFDAIRNMILRAKVGTAIVAGRTIVQLGGLDEDTHERVELLLPPGYVANPVVGSDILELQIAGFASHKVALGGDNTADSLVDLQPGESGLANGARGQQIVLRVTGTELVGALLQWGPTRDAMRRLVQEEFVALFNAHTHNVSGGITEAPNQQMTAAHLTGET